jgi:hypothetical protein
VKGSAMRQIVIAVLFLISVSVSISAQELVTDLNGFRLGQYRTVPKNEFQKLLKKDKLAGGFEYEAYAAAADESVYMVFEYAESDPQVIRSIQVTGSNKGYDCRFKGLKLGMPAKEVERTIGKPSSIEDIGEYGKQWNYDGNFDLEINPNGVLSSVKIEDTFPDLKGKDTSKIPGFEKYSGILKSKDRKAISELLAPSLEIYKNGATHSFKRAWANEVKSDLSGIFALMDEVVKLVEKTDPHNEAQYEENVRISVGQDPLHVAKFKINGKKSEIVFKYMFGKYLIWEIQLN